MSRSRGDSIHLEDIPERVSEDFDKYMEEASYANERKSVVDEESAKKFINDVLPRKPGLGAFFPNHAYESDYQLLIKGNFIQKLMSENKMEKSGVLRKVDSDALLAAQNFEGQRKKKYRLVDERRDAKKIVPVTAEGVRRWKKNPGRMDVAGVDTIAKISPRGKIYTPKRTNKWVRTVRMRGVRQYYVYRDKKGRFLKNPERRA